MSKFLQLQNGKTVSTELVIPSSGELLPLGDAESTNPFVMYADGTATPVDGTGGSPTATVTQSASSPLSKTQSFIFNSGALGNGAAYAFTIDEASKNTMQTLTISTDGAFVQGDVSLWLYDVTNSRLINPQPSSYLAKTPTKQQFFFQLSSGTSYKLLIHQSTSNSFNAKFEVSMVNMPFAGYANAGTFIAGQILAFSSVTPPANFLYCNGQTVNRADYPELFSAIGTTYGAGNGSTTFHIPDFRGQFLRGFDDTANRDPDKASRTAMNSGGNTGNNIGSIQSDQFKSHDHDTGQHPSGGLAPPYNGSYPVADATTIRTGFSGGNETRPTNASIAYHICYKSVTSVNITEYDGRVVAAMYRASTGGGTTGNAIIFDTKEFDTHNFYNTSTGRFTPKVAGYYRVDSDQYWGGPANFGLYKNGSLYCHMATPVGAATGAGTAKVYLNGSTDYIDLRSDANFTFTSGGGVWTIPMINWVSFELLSGAQQILPGQRVVTEGYHSTTQVLTANTTKIKFDTVSTDNTNSWSQVNDEWTVPANGSYMISLATSHSSANSAGYYVKQTGSQTRSKQLHWTGSGYTGPETGTTTMELVAGDKIAFYSDASLTIAGGGTPQNCHFSIAMVGSFLLDQRPLTDLYKLPEPSNALTMGANVTVDWNLSSLFTGTMTGASTFAFSNVVENRSITVIIKGHASNDYTITFPTLVKRTDFATTVKANKTNVYNFIRSGGVILASVIEDLT
jgi:hypothetical protein